MIFYPDGNVPRGREPLLHDDLPLHPRQLCIHLPLGLPPWQASSHLYILISSLKYFVRPLIGKDIPIPYMNLTTSLVSFTVPLLLGVAFKRKWPKKALVLSKRVNLKFTEIWVSPKFMIYEGVSTILLCRAHHPTHCRLLVNTFLQNTPKT